MIGLEMESGLVELATLVGTERPSIFELKTSEGLVPSLKVWNLDIGLD